LFLGSWGFAGAGEVSFLFLALGTYLYIHGRRRARTLRDDASNLERALQLSSEGRAEESIELLTRLIRQRPRLWQALQYRGQLHLQRGSIEDALRDLSKAIELAPQEAHLYALRSQARVLLGDEEGARQDWESAAALREG
jgi:Flp pilus assembly protein TadD